MMTIGRGNGVLWGFTLLTLVFLGCAGIGQPLKAPEIRLAGLSVENADLFETVLHLKLRVINGNDIPLEIKGIECELKVNDKQLASGVSGTTVQIPAFGSSTVTMTVYSSAYSIFSTLFHFMQRELQNPSEEIDISYQLKGRVHLANTTLMPSTLSFRTEGNLRFDENFDRQMELTH